MPRFPLFHLFLTPISYHILFLVSFPLIHTRVQRKEKESKQPKSLIYLSECQFKMSNAILLLKFATYSL